MKITYLSIFILILFSSLPATAFSLEDLHDMNNVYVSSLGSDTTGNGSSSNPFQTLSKAIGTVSDNGTIHVANGVYKGSSNRNLTINKNMRIIKEDGASHDTAAQIDAESVDRIFTITNKVNVVIDGLTFSNGQSKDDLNDSDASDGGAINNVDSNVVIKNCVFDSNYASDFGGAIYNKGVLTVENSTFNNNSVGSASSLGYGGAISNKGTGSIKSSTFTKNKALLEAGAIYNEFGTLSAVNCTFTSNTAANKICGRGGGISNRAKILITDSLFKSNTAGLTYNGGGGGAMVNYRLANVSKCHFEDNQATMGGGAIYNLENLDITNSNFTRNKAHYVGGAIVNSKDVTMSNVTALGNVAQYGGFIDNGAFESTSISCSVVNSVFLVNKAFVNGGAFYNTNSSNVNIQASNLADNDANDSGGAVVNKGNLTLQKSNITGNRATKCCGGLYNIYGNVTILASRLANNGAIKGGGIYNGWGNMIITDSSIANNKASWGGGIYNYAETSTTIKNSNLTGNTAKDANTGGGGGIWNIGKLSLDSVLITINHADIGGGIWNTKDPMTHSTGNMSILNSQINDNDAPTGKNIQDDTLSKISKIVSVSNKFM